MKATEENGNPFLKQMSKLFEDLAAGQKAKPPISPRITCTRLRRLREIRCELVQEQDYDPNLAQSAAEDIENTVAQLNSARTKNENFASWVLRNKKAHKQFDTLSVLSREKSLSKKEDDGSSALSNFSPSALKRVAKNPLTPMSTLKWLAMHCSADIRQVVAANHNAGEEIMAVLAIDIDEEVRTILIENKALKREFLLKLCDDSSPLVSEKAKNILYSQNKTEVASADQQTADNVVISSKLELNQIKSVETKDRSESEMIENEFLQVIAERVTTPTRRLAELAVHPDKTIRCMVAANPNATPEILWLLAKDNSMDVRRKLLSNYNCPEEIIDSLMRK